MMSTAIHDSSMYFPREDSPPEDQFDLQYFEDNARSVELVREEGKDGQLGSFGFTLYQEKPPRIGTIIPGGPANRANLKKGDIVLAVAGQDVTQMSHREVTAFIRAVKTSAVWLSICEDDQNSPNTSLNSTFMSKSMYASTPIINSQQDTYYMRKFPGLSSSYTNSSAMLYSGGPKITPSPLVQKRSVPQNDPAYVAFVSHSFYVVTRLSVMLLYCGPVKIPDSWSSRGVSSLCIQECARQLLGKRRSEEFIKVQLEISQNSLRITNIAGNVLAKHHRYELYYCGLCSNDEQYFAIVTKNDHPTMVQAELCHVFKLQPDSKLSTYCIDKSKSQREARSGQPVSLKSCVEITETIQSIFQNESTHHTPTLKRNADVNSSDGIDYGVIRGVSTFQLAPPTSESFHNSSSPLLKRKKSNVIDLRSKSSPSPQVRGLQHNGKQRSTSIPINPPHSLRLTPTNSAGNLHNIGHTESVHVRMHSDGSTRPMMPLSILRQHTPQDTVAKRMSDSSLSSVSSDHSFNQSHSPNSGKNGSPTPNQQQHQHTPLQYVSPQRKVSFPSRNGAVSPNETIGTNSKGQLRRQGSESSVLDLPGLSPFHQSRKNMMSGSVDSIVTITTLAEDDVESVIGQVAGWCGSFDKLLSDPLGVQYLLSFLETEHSEENILFWNEVQEFKKLPEPSIRVNAKRIFDEFISQSAPRLINIDERVSKNVEQNLNLPMRQIFDEAQKEIYQLVKLDCYPRFKKWQVIKDCLRAEMEGQPLPSPVQMTTSTSPSQATRPAVSTKPTNSTTNTTWPKKKNQSLLSRLRGLQHKSVTAPSLAINEHPLTQSVDVKKQKKDKRESHKKQRTKSEEYRPEESLKQFQVHKSNLFEVSLPNRVTKILEAHPQTTIREAITHVLKKYNYSLDIMEVKLTSTLQPVDVDLPAAILIGKHISITRSKHTVTITFPDCPQVILPADGSTTVRLLLDKILSEKGKTDSYSVYLEGARAPLELNMSTAVLEGHVVAVRYNPPLTKPSNTSSTPPKRPVFNLSSESGSSIGSNSSGKASEGVDELFSMIARLGSDTLHDQRIVDDQIVKKNFHAKKGKTKFSRTKSGNAISEKVLKPINMPPPRSYSPPPGRYPPPPSSDPPTLSYSLLNKPYSGASSSAWSDVGTHYRQRSTDAMSGISNESCSSVDSISHELAADRCMNARNWVNSNSQMGFANGGGSMIGLNGPRYFPTAFSSQDTLSQLQSQKRSSLPRQMYQQTTFPMAGAGNSYYKQGTWPHNGSEYTLKPGPGSTASSHHFSDTESVASSSCHSNATSGCHGNSKPPLSPTTHVLVIDENTQRSETFV